MKKIIGICFILMISTSAQAYDSLTIGNCHEIREECIGRKLYTIVYNTCTDQVIDHRQVLEADRKTRSVALPVRCN